MNKKLLILVVWKGNTYNYLISFYPNSRTKHPLIKGHVLGELMLHHVMPNLLSPILLWSTSTSTSPQAYHDQPLTPPYWSICATILVLFQHLVHHGARSYLVPNIFITNLISPVVPTGPSQHAHFCYILLVVVEVFDLPILCSYYNIPSVIPQVEFGKGSVYTDLTPTR